MRDTEQEVLVSDQPDCPVDLSRASLTGDSQEGFKASDVDVSKVRNCVISSSFLLSIYFLPLWNDEFTRQIQ